MIINPIQLKDIGTTETTADNADYLILQNPTSGQTYKITKANLLAGLSTGGSGGSSSGSTQSLDTILYRDANWCLSPRGNQYCDKQSLQWTSWGLEAAGSDGNTGKIKIGYLTLKNKLHLMMAGGGSTNPMQKTMKFVRASNNTNLLTLNLGQIIGVDTNTLVFATIDTSSINGESVYLEFEDTSGGGYGWISFTPDMFVE